MAEEPSTASSSLEESEEEEQTPVNVEPVQQDAAYLNEIAEHATYIASLRKELRLLVIRNPQLKPFEESELDQKLKALSKEELETILENVKIDLGIMRPCVAGNTITMLIGQFFERAFGMTGFTQRLQNNSEFVVSMDSFVPHKFLQHGPKVKAAEALLTEYLAYQKNPNAS